MPSVEYRTGDLFTAEAGVALAHGVNTQGVMGAGIALEFKKRYPEMFEKYKFQCKHGFLIPGYSFIWQDKEKINPIICNLASQDYPGAHARYEWVQESIEDALNRLGETIEAMALPRIGCGIGGLDWKNVKVIIEKIAETTDTQLIVYSL